jgi:hypothetical protein
MKLYKVVISKNKPVFAEEIAFADLEKNNDNAIDEQGVIKWLPVWGYDERDSIELAKKLIKDILA